MCFAPNGFPVFYPCRVRNVLSIYMEKQAMKRSLSAALVAGILTVGAAATALAHHGWRWTTGGNIELTGIIAAAELGMPHGVLKVDAEGEIWTVEVGQPWRNKRAGLKDGDLRKGVEIRIVGEPSARA